MLGTFNIRFDYRFDTNGFFDDSSRVAALERAGEVWETIIGDEFADVPAGTVFSINDPQTGVTESVTLSEAIDDLLVFVGSSSPPRGSMGNALATGGPDGFDAEGDVFRVRIDDDFRNGGPVTNFEPWAGTISFDPTIDWSFDLDAPAEGTFDFVSVAVHELGHVLGFGTSGAFDAFGADLSFDGPNARSANGGADVPLESDASHVVDGFNNDSVVMDPTIGPGVRKLPTDIDLAMLADIGFATTGFTAQGTTPAVATEGDEVIFGTILADTIDALGGDDQPQGEAGNDTILGGSGSDTIFGQDGDDSLDGGAGTDQLQGGAGNDTLTGGAGEDVLFGQDGTDRFLATPGIDRDQIEDFDLDTEVILVDSAFGFAAVADILETIQKVALNVSRIVLSTTDSIDVRHSSMAGTPLTAAHFEILQVGDDSPITGTAGDDTLTGTDGDDTILGLGGDDQITALDGQDSVDAGAGADFVEAGAGDDTVDGGDGFDDLRGDAGNDRLIGGEFVEGGDGDDVLIAGTEATFLSGNAGNDTITGSAGAQSLVGGDGEDSLDGDAGDDTLTGSAGNDTMRGGLGNDELDGGEGTDEAIFSGNRADYSVTIAGSSATISGADGVDHLTGVETARFDDQSIIIGQTPPNAEGDSITIGNTEVSDNLHSLLLENDTDVDGDVLDISAVDTSQTTGLVIFDGDTDTLTYDPNGQFDQLAPGDTAVDSFSYTVNDGNGGSDTASVSVTITAPDGNGDGETNLTLGPADDNINIDGSANFRDFGGVDTYSLLSTLSQDVTVTDTSGATINLVSGLTMVDPLFLSNGLQFSVNGNVVTFLGAPEDFTYVFAGTPLDPNAGVARTFDQTAQIFGTTVPAPGEAANAGTSGTIEPDGAVSDLATMSAIGVSGSWEFDFV